MIYSIKHFTEKTIFNSRLNDPVRSEGMGGKIQYYKTLREYLRSLFAEGYTKYEIFKAGVRDIIRLKKSDKIYMDFGTKEVQEFIITELGRLLDGDPIPYAETLAPQLSNLKQDLRKFREKDYEEFINKSLSEVQLFDIPILTNNKNQIDDLRREDILTPDTLDIWLEVAKDSKQLYDSMIKEYGKVPLVVDFNQIQKGIFNKVVQFASQEVDKNEMIDFYTKLKSTGMAM